MSRLGNKLRDPREVIIRPYLTERTTDLASDASHPVYVFSVRSSATKAEVIRAFQAIYGVRPLRVNITNTPAKRITVRGRAGQRPGARKAFVFLRVGEKIDFV